MEAVYRKYLMTGARHGSGYSLCMRQGMFDGFSGTRLGSGSGSSLEFMEHRDYMPGDDLRTLDWGVYARTERLAVKMYREEINPRLDIIIDGSASMAVAETKKAEAALGLAGIITAAASNSSFITRSWMLRDRLEPVINGSSARPEQWGGMAFESDPDFGGALKSLPGGLYHHGIRVVVSDFFWPLDVRGFLQRLGAGAAAVILLQVASHADLHPGEYGNIRLCDSETLRNEDLFVDAAAVRKYLDALGRHQDNWYRVSRECGAEFVTFEAEDLVENWNLEELIRREILQAG